MSMTEFREQDLTGARFERVSLRGATFSQVQLNDARMNRVDFTAGWPQEENFPLKECLGIILNEEWEHRLYAERDLTALEKEN